MSRQNRTMMCDGGGSAARVRRRRRSGVFLQWNHAKSARGSIRSSFDPLAATSSHHSAPQLKPRLSRRCFCRAYRRFGSTDPSVELPTLSSGEGMRHARVHRDGPIEARCGKGTIDADLSFLPLFPSLTAQRRPDQVPPLERKRAHRCEIEDHGSGATTTSRRTDLSDFIQALTRIRGSNAAGVQLRRRSAECTRDVIFRNRFAGPLLSAAAWQL